jgi:predicted amidohydrolase
MSKSQSVDYLLASDIDAADHDAWVDEDWGDLLASGKADIEDCMTDWELQNAEEDWANYVSSRAHARECLKNSAERDYNRAREDDLYEYMDTGFVEGFTPTPADEILRQNWLERRERKDIPVVPSHLF